MCILQTTIKKLLQYNWILSDWLWFELKSYAWFYFRKWEVSEKSRSHDFLVLSRKYNDLSTRTNEVFAPNSKSNTTFQPWDIKYYRGQVRVDNHHHGRNNVQAWDILKFDWSKMTSPWKKTLFSSVVVNYLPLLNLGFRTNLGKKDNLGRSVKYTHVTGGKLTLSSEIICYLKGMN